MQSTSEFNTYTIKSGDTFWGIEEEWGIPYDTLKKMNPEYDPRNLPIDAEILMPPMLIIGSLPSDTIPIEGGMCYHRPEWEEGCTDDFYSSSSSIPSPNIELGSMAMPGLALGGTTGTTLTAGRAAGITRAAGTLATGWGGAVVEPTIAGEIIMGIATGIAVLYYGQELIDKMVSEIENIIAKNKQPLGVQYALVATHSGNYTCFKCPGGTMYLNVNEVWKYGETTKPMDRYSTTYLTTNKVRKVDEFPGKQWEIKVMEKFKIYGYFFVNGHLPPGNKIFR